MIIQLSLGTENGDAGQKWEMREDGVLTNQVLGVHCAPPPPPPPHHVIAYICASRRKSLTHPNRLG